MPEKSAPTTPKKVAAKKPAVQKAAPEHPKFPVMITEALTKLADRKGTSKIAIEKYLCANYKLGVNYDRALKKALKAMMEANTLTKPKGVGLTGSFKLAKVEKPKAVKKPVAKSPKKVVKKPAAKKPAAKKPAAKVVKKVVAKSPKKPAAKKAPAKSPVKKVAAKVTKKVATPKKAVKKPVGRKAKK
jgi:histone H1/5